MSWLRSNCFTLIWRWMPMREDVKCHYSSNARSLKWIKIIYLRFPRFKHNIVMRKASSRHLCNRLISNYFEIKFWPHVTFSPKILIQLSYKLTNDELIYFRNYKPSKGIKFLFQLGRRYCLIQIIKPACSIIFNRFRSKCFEKIESIRFSG